MARVIVPAMLAGACAVGLVTVGAGAAGASSPTITLYSGQHEQTTQSLVAAFEKATGINVTVRNDDEDTFADEIVTERSDPVADVFYTENSPPLEYLPDKGLLATWTPRRWPTRPVSTTRPHGDWVGVSARVSVLIYNPSLIQRLSSRPRFSGWPTRSTKGKLAFAAGETDFQPIVTSMDQHLWKAATRRGSMGSRPMPAVTSTPTTRPSPMKSTGAPSPSAWSTSTTGTA